jgi:hypothetical protein
VKAEIKTVMVVEKVKHLKNKQISFDALLAKKD